MSSIDPAKLKVVELRAELTSRGLDAKGNKPVLVKRLKDALEQELQEEIADTSIADTSTEDINTSQESLGDEVQAEPPDKIDEQLSAGDTKPAEEKQQTVEVEEPVVEEQPDKEEPAAVEEVPASIEHEPEEKPQDDVLDESAILPEKNSEISENGDNLEETEETGVAKPPEVESMEVTGDDKVAEAKGEKRRHSSPSPERVQRKRSKSPIKEDEPAIDNNKVQLSWYDSDLHLQIDKKTFLSGKPYHEGAFGYAWAGARATHGVKAGKVYFEVKVTEELKWDDLVKQSDRRRDGHRVDNSRRDRQRIDKDNIKSESSKSPEENVEKPSVDSTESKETEVKEEECKAHIKMEIDIDIKEESFVETDKVEETVKVEPDDVKPLENQEKLGGTVVEEVPAESVSKHLIRVGWSVGETTLQLGEDEFSYGYESTGRFVTNKVFTNYGAKFGTGDVIGAYLDITDEFVILNFTVNGELQPEIDSISRSEIPLENFALFPHVLARNVSFEVNFGSLENPWFPSPESFMDYEFIGSAEDKIEGPQRPQLRNECEVIMMCGLPASGKTEWIRNMLNENLDKRYTIIGNSHLLEKMTVNGNPLKNSYKGRWNVILDRLMKCVNILVETAALRRRNFIIDQTNVFPSAQRRKMRLFEGFKRRAVVVVVADDEQAKRRALQEAQDGKDVPDSAILEMKANMSLPKRGDWLEEVSFVELNEEEAKGVVQKYNQQGREAGFGPIAGGQRSGYRDNRGHPYRWDHSTSRRDYRGGYRDHRHQSNRYDRSRQHGGWHNRRPPPGSWNRDIRRDGRGNSRDFRNNNRSDSGNRSDRSSNRDNRNRSQSSSQYNRNPRSQSNRNQPTSWQGGSSGWQNQGNWGQGTWNQGSWNQGGWGGGSGSQPPQWKNNYGQGGYNQGYGNYPNWNYYSYPQNWNSQGQPQTTTAGGTMASDSDNMGYNQYSQQAAWAQYAQQYPQDQTGNSDQQQSLPK